MNRAVLALLVVMAACGSSQAFFPSSELDNIFHYRARRSPPSVRCCNDGFEDSENHQRVAAVRHECKEELGLTENSDAELLNDRENQICLIECILKKHDLADENGDLLHEDFAKALKDHFGVAEWKVPLLDDFIKSCYVNAEEEHLLHPDKEGQCNREGFNFVYCMRRQFILACPEQMQDDSERCDSIREKLKSNENVGFWNNDLEETK